MGARALGSISIAPAIPATTSHTISHCLHPSDTPNDTQKHTYSAIHILFTYFSSKSYILFALFTRMGARALGSIASRRPYRPLPATRSLTVYIHQTLLMIHRSTHTVQYISYLPISHLILFFICSFYP
jgi:hypothetical protein